MFKFAELKIFVLPVQCSSRYESTSFPFKEIPKDHFRLNDMLKHVELLFSKLKTTGKMMCTKGTLMLIFTLFVFVIPSQSTAGKKDHLVLSFAKSQLKIIA